MKCSIREKLLSGDPLHFSGDEPEKERLIMAEWLGEAVRQGVRIDVRKAVIRGALNLQYTTFEREVSLIACEMKERANFSYTNFKRNLILSGTTFHQGANFSCANLEYDAWLQGTQFLTKEATFLDFHVHGAFYAVAAHFGNGVKANFNRARFDNVAFFHAGIFEGGADFVSSQIGSEANFTEALFNAGEATFVDLHVHDFYASRAHFANGVMAHFNRARFDKSAFFDGAIFTGEANFGAAEIGGAAIFTGARFNSKDKPAIFNRAKIDGTAFFEGCTFEGEANFGAAEIGAAAIFTGARFNSKDKPAIFNSAKFDSVAIFEGSTFEGEANFGGAQIEGEAHFKGARFNSKDKPAIFNSAKFDSVAIFEGSTFEGEANFSAAQIGQAVFIGARFNSKDKPASFMSVRIDYEALFNDSIFQSEARFTDAEIRGSAIFNNAVFLESSKPSFQGTKFQKGAFFRGAKFQDAVNFRTAQFHREARFYGVTFANKADFGASHFTGLAQFSAGEGGPGTVFKDVSFEHSRFEHDARFDDVVFQGETSFRDASFLTVYFSPEGVAQGQQQFQGSVDLRGCVYKRIEVDRKSLLKRAAPYDRQPYTQLERVYRAVGEDWKADETYLERRRVEHRRLSFRREPFRWLGDWLYKWVARYGVRPYRLIFFSFILLALGTFVFLRPIAVEMKSDKQPAELAQSKAPIRNNTDASTQRREEFTGWDALRLSIRLFLPVDVPLATRWEPSDKRFGPLRFSDYATLLKLAGWVFVPLGIAALTGLLRRVAP